MTRGMRQKLNQGFYRYEVTFEEEAAISNGTYNSNQSQYKDLKELPAVDRKKFERELRCDTIKAKECIICFEELNKEPQSGNNIDFFVKTPCNHKFHKKCLRDWMVEKNECPVCR